MHSDKPELEVLQLPDDALPVETGKKIPCDQAVLGLPKMEMIFPSMWGFICGWMKA